MKIVNIIGGLGNQMFQYAFAVALKAKYPNEEVLLILNIIKMLSLRFIMAITFIIMVMR